MSAGDFSILVTRPISGTLIAASALVLVVSTLRFATVRAMKQADSV